VAWKRSAPAVPRQAKAVVEEFCGAVHAERSDSTRAQFDRQRETIELSTDIGDDRCIGIVQFVIAAVGTSAFDK